MIVSVTVMGTGVPIDGVMITVAEYVPGTIFATFTLNVIGVTCPAVLLPVVGEITNQVGNGAPTVHVNVLPPGF